MSTYASWFPKVLFLALLTMVLGVAVLGVTPPGTSPGRALLGQAVAGEGEDGGSDESGGEEPADIFGGETTFSEAQVGKAIDKGVAWLMKKQGRDGSWGEISGGTFYGGGQDDGQRRGYGHPAGPTALALYTLLKCKTPVKHDTIKNGFKFIKDNRHKEPRGAYETAMLLLAVTATADPYKTSAASGKIEADDRIQLKGEYRGWAQKLVDHLADHRFGGAKGWRYHINDTPAAGGPEDLSSTQLAALALFAANRGKIRPKNKDVWEDILAFSLAQQSADGPESEITDPEDRSKKYKARSRGFSYIKGDSEAQHNTPSGSMTACALANIEMARYVLRSGKGGREAWDKRPDAAQVQEALYDGLAWLNTNWSPFVNPHPGMPHNQGSYHVYYLYSVERAMDLFGLRLIDSHNWYSEMGQELINRQYEDGHWDADASLEPQDVLDTCFALLFLKRATGGSIAFPSFTNGGGQAADNR
jgi:hypothetical protein